MSQEIETIDSDKIITLINEGKYDDVMSYIGLLIDKKEKIQELYPEWWRNRTQDELKLLTKAFYFENKYFKDLTLQIFDEDLNKYQIKHDNAWEEVQDSLQDQMILTIEDRWIFKINDDIEADGQCDFKRRTIEIKQKYKDDVPTILHEMIHAYEFMLPEHYRQLLIIFLFKKLNQKVTNLVKYIKKDSHSLLRVRSPLFLLKSIDLDIRLKKPLGTVYAYDRTNLF